MDKVQTNKQKNTCARQHRAKCVEQKGSLVRCRMNPSAAASVSKTPEELQRQFIREKHGGAHGETSDGVDGGSAEENLQAAGQRFRGVGGHTGAACHPADVTADIPVHSLVACQTVLKHLPSLT